MPERKPGETWRCGLCNGPLIGAEVVEGRVTPIDHTPVPEGTLVLFRPPPHSALAGRMQVRALKGDTLDEMRAVGIPMHTNHYDTCPERERIKHTPGAIAAALTGGEG